MRKIIFVTCAIVFVWPDLFSQIKKGNMQLGGALGYSKYSQEQFSFGRPKFNSVNTSWSILPNFGYFITETSSLGIGVGYEQFILETKSVGSELILIGQPGVISSGTLYTSLAKSTRGQLVIKPYYRVHKIISQSFVLFAELNAFYGFGNREETGNYIVTQLGLNGSIVSETSNSSTFSEKLNTWGFGLTPGIIFFPNQKWGIELNVGLLGYSEIIGEQSNTSSNIILQPSLNNLSLGLKYYILK
jgi:hypothetical protein